MGKLSVLLMLIIYKDLCNIKLKLNLNVSATKKE